MVNLFKGEGVPGSLGTPLIKAIKKSQETRRCCIKPILHEHKD